MRLLEPIVACLASSCVWTLRVWGVCNHMETQGLAHSHLRRCLQKRKIAREQMAGLGHKLEQTCVLTTLPRRHGGAGPPGNRCNRVHLCMTVSAHLELHTCAPPDQDCESVCISTAAGGRLDAVDD